MSVGITKEDQDALRFLWIDDTILSHPHVLICFLFFFLAGGRSLKEKFKGKTPVIVENIEKLLYMDDISTGADKTEDARKI